MGFGWREGGLEVTLKTKTKALHSLPLQIIHIIHTSFGRVVGNNQSVILLNVIRDIECHTVSLHGVSPRDV